MDKIEFGGWTLALDFEDAAKVEIISDNKRLIVMQEEQYYLLYASLNKGNLSLRNVDSSLVLNFELESNTIHLSLKEEV